MTGHYYITDHHGTPLRAHPNNRPDREVKPTKGKQFGYVWWQWLALGLGLFWTIGLAL